MDNVGIVIQEDEVFQSPRIFGARTQNEKLVSLGLWHLDPGHDETLHEILGHLEEAEAVGCPLGHTD